MCIILLRFSLSLALHVFDCIRRGTSEQKKMCFYGNFSGLLMMSRCCSVECRTTNSHLLATIHPSVDWHLESKKAVWFLICFNFQFKFSALRSSHDVQLSMNSKFIMCLLLCRPCAGTLSSTVPLMFTTRFIFFVCQFYWSTDCTLMRPRWPIVWAERQPLWRAHSPHGKTEVSELIFLILHFNEINKMPHKEIIYTKLTPSTCHLLQPPVGRDRHATPFGQRTNQLWNANFYSFWQEIIKLD